MSETPEYISIKERIERRIAEVIGGVDGVGGIPGVGKVFRWDARGPRDDKGNQVNPGHQDAGFDAGDERSTTDATGSRSLVVKTMPLNVGVVLCQSEDDMLNGSILHNRWIAKIEKALMADLQWEVGGVRLALNTRVTATYKASYQTTDEQQDNMYISGVAIEIEYQHYENDPCAGPGITAEILNSES